MKNWSTIFSPYLINVTDLGIVHSSLDMDMKNNLSTIFSSLLPDKIKDWGSSALIL